jgi:hypothetical protein
MAGQRHLRACARTAIHDLAPLKQPCRHPPPSRWRMEPPLCTGLDPQLSLREATFPLPNSRPLPLGLNSSTACSLSVFFEPLRSVLQRRRRPYISSRWRRCGPTPMPLRTRRANVSTRPSRSYGWGGCQKRDRDECRRLAATFASYDKTQTMKPSCALTRGSAAPFTSRSSPLMAAVRMSAGAPTNAIWQREHPKSKQRTSQR